MSAPDSTPGAPGHPGIDPKWTSSAKTGVGTAIGGDSRVWFTLSHGILNEVYYPRIDQACTRDCGLVVTDGESFFSEEKRHTTSEVHPAAPGVPAFRLVNRCRENRYRIEKEVLADPRRDVVLQRIRLVAVDADRAALRLHVLLAPHLGNRGSGNTAWIGEFKGHDLLFAERDGLALALASSIPWRGRSCGFVGFSDGWQDLSRHKRLTWFHGRAADGNVALVGELGIPSTDADIVLALGFGRNPNQAAQSALLSLRDGFEPAQAEYVGEWHAWHAKLHSLGGLPAEQRALARTSAAVLRIHEDKRAAGGLIAALAVPWGSSKGDDDLGGYHLVWPRDLVEAAGALAALGAAEDVGRVLEYLQVTQEADGHWPQNMWLDGTPYWTGVQMDETALPILLVDLARRKELLGGIELTRLWPMVRSAAGFLVRNGPVTPQDRWEEDAGYSPFTLAAEISALLAAADLAEQCGEPDLGPYLRQTADAWNANVERWTFARGTEIGRDLGVDGYYVRIAAPDRATASSPVGGFVPIKNRPPGESRGEAERIVSPDALALVRFGLRAPDDPRIEATVRVVDALLRVDMPGGPCWHRYNRDGYGEHEDGSPFDGTGVGRAWPLLTGERGHYELAAGRRDEAERMARTLSTFANEGGLLPEQIWDAEDLPSRELFFGRPSGSAMPLVWAHAEYIKLRRSLADGEVFDLPPQPVARYQRDRVGSRHFPWRFNQRCRQAPAGLVLRIEILAPAIVRWTSDAWRTSHDTTSEDKGLGIHVADLPTADLPAGSEVELTFRWSEGERWEGRNYAVTLTREP